MNTQTVKQPLIQVQNIAKRFGETVAVADVSFDVKPGEVFGLLGPNGAGKTTTIRMILDIFQPDAGKIAVFGGPLTARNQDRIGYMPEERGLYPHMRVIDCLIYLGKLKGLTKQEAQTRAEHYLSRLELADQPRTKIEALSRGMTQKVQVIAAIIHNPDLLIIDEPFANLDPVNSKLVRDILLELRDQGKSVVMTSHQLGLVEALCDRIAMIHHGKVILAGTVADVRRQFASNILHISGSGDLPTLPAAVTHVERRTASDWYLTLSEDVDHQHVLQTLLAQTTFALDSFEIARPSLDEIFVQIVRGSES
ncbi:MAG: ATP-binding cassette domain-containing protein [Chloroflexota bacterium]